MTYSILISTYVNIDDVDGNDDGDKDTIDDYDDDGNDKYTIYDDDDDGYDDNVMMLLISDNDDVDNNI